MEYLKCKLQVQCAKHRSRSHPAHVEQNIPLERNNSTGRAQPLGSPPTILTPTSMALDQV